MQRSELAAAAVAGHAEARQVQLVVERAAFVPGVALQLLEQAIKKSNLLAPTLTSYRKAKNCGYCTEAANCSCAAEALASRGTPLCCPR